MSRVNNLNNRRSSLSLFLRQNAITEVTSPPKKTNKKRNRIKIWRTLHQKDVSFISMRLKGYRCILSIYHVYLTHLQNQCLMVVDCRALRYICR